MWTRGDGVGERVFISYGEADREYVGRLAQYLAQAGIGSSYDANSAGQRVDAHVEDQIDDCGAFIVVMTPESLSSAEVNNDLYRARARAKAVLPVLLRGEVFGTLRDAEVFNARDGRLPDDAFLGRLRAALRIPDASEPAPPTVLMNTLPPVSPLVPVGEPPLPAGYAAGSLHRRATHPFRRRIQRQAYPPPGVPMPPPGYGPVPPQVPGQYPVPAPGPRKHLGLIVGIVVVAVLVAIAGVVVATRFLAADTPRSAVEAWLGAIKDENIGKIRSLTCARYQSDVEDFQVPDDVTDFTWNITDVNEIDEDSATATVEVSFNEGGQPERESATFSMVKENGDWKVCGPAEESP